MVETADACGIRTQLVIADLSRQQDDEAATIRAAARMTLPTLAISRSPVLFFGTTATRPIATGAPMIAALYGADQALRGSCRSDDRNDLILVRC
jgi:hypothetical protein